MKEEKYISNLETTHLHDMLGVNHSHNSFQSLYVGLSGNHG